MTDWVEDTLQKIAATDDLHISPLREDGKTYGTPTWIWSVVVDNALFVRAYNGQDSRWYQAAIRQKTGRIRAADKTYDVIFEPVDGPVTDRIDTDQIDTDHIDEAYRAKYKSNPYLGSMIGARARSATVRIVPQGNQR